MKKLLFISILIIFAAKLNAQKIQFQETGIKAGTNTSFSSELPETASQKLKLGYTVGSYTRFKLFGFFLQPEILIFHGKSNYYFYISDNIHTYTPAQIAKEESWIGLQIPVLFGKKINLGKIGLNLYVGPAFTMTLEGSYNIITTPTTPPLPPLPTSYVEKGKYNQNDLLSALVWQAGLGLEVSRFNLDMRYQQQFARGPKGLGLQFTVGYKLFQRRTQR